MSAITYSHSRAYSQELARIEEEITTLRTVLASKVRRQSELKRKLGISVWREISDDMNQGIKNVKESDVYVYWHFFMYRGGQRTPTHLPRSGGECAKGFFTFLFMILLPVVGIIVPYPVTQVVVVVALSLLFTFIIILYFIVLFLVPTLIPITIPATPV